MYTVQGELIKIFHFKWEHLKKILPLWGNARFVIYSNHKKMIMVTLCVNINLTHNTYSNVQKNEGPKTFTLCNFVSNYVTNNSFGKVSK